LDTQEAAEYEALRSLDSREEDYALKTAKMTWADRIRAEGLRDGMEQGLEQGMEQGRVRGIEEGLERGREQGARRILLRLLGLRFGPLPKKTRLKVEAIDSLETLSQLADRVLVARSLDELGLT